MKNLIKYLVVLQLSFFLLGCNNDDSLYRVTLNESFVAKKGCEYTCVTDDSDIITIEIDDIVDMREYGTGCQVSWGGHAEVSIDIAINKKEYSKTFTWQGCDGLEEYPATMTTLPKLEMENGYVLKMMKMYPLSETQETTPTSEKDYEIRLIILK